MEILVPATLSHPEEHSDAEQGADTFETTYKNQPPSGPHMDVGALKKYNDPNNEADGGGTVPLPPGFGGRDDSSTTPNLIYVPGTNTVWDYDENPTDPSAPWTPKEGIDELVNPGTFSSFILNIPQLPKDVNRVVEIPDVNNDGVKDLAIVTENGVYLMLTESTTNILLEAATFDPVLVRRTSRLHGIASDSSFRYERGVSPLQVDEAAQRFASLILEHAGGTLCRGVVETGAELPTRREVSMRTDRCRSILGQDTSNEAMLEVLTGRLVMSGVTARAAIAALAQDIQSDDPDIQGFLTKCREHDWSCFVHISEDHNISFYGQDDVLEVMFVRNNTLKGIWHTKIAKPAPIQLDRLRIFNK
mgnify:CR=1 FL=1